MRLNFLLLLFIMKILLGVTTFFSNPESVDEYRSFGLYRENQYQKKLPLSASNWYFQMEGEDDWKKLYVPSAYIAGSKSQKIFFKTSFILGDFDKDSNHFKLVFYGVNYSCRVKINDCFVENHSAGYNSFYIDLNNSILNFNGKNELIIEVANQLSLDKTLPVKNNTENWCNYGGIFRDVFLVLSSHVAISDCNVNYSFFNDYQNVNVNVSIKVKDFRYVYLDNKSKYDYQEEYAVRFKIYDKDSTCVFISDTKKELIQRYAEQKIEFDFFLKDIDLWSPSTPDNYLFKVELLKIKDGKVVEDIFHQYDFDFGFREIKISGNNISLNGKRFHMKGVTYFEDAPKMGNALTYERMMRDIESIKNLGVNTIYILHGPPHPFILDLCNKYGLFIIEKLPLLSTPSEVLTQKSYLMQVNDYLFDLVSRDKNDVSFLGVCLASGVDVFNLKAVDVLKDLSDYAKSISPRLLTVIDSKITSYQEYYRLVDMNLISIESSEITDNNEVLKEIDRVSKNQPVALLARLSSVFPRDEQVFSDPHSESAQAKKIFELQRDIKNRTELEGIIFDSFADHYSNVPLLFSEPGDNPYLINSGLVDYDRKIRISYRVVESIFKESKMPSLNKGEYSESQKNIFFFLGIILTVILIYLLKREHYFRINMVRYLKNSDAFFVDIRDRRTTQMWHPVIISIFSAIGISSMIASIFYYYRNNRDFDYLTTILFDKLNIKGIIVNLTWSPYKFIIVSSLLVMFIYFMITVYMKTLSLFSDSHRSSFSIMISLIFWNSSLFLWMLPISAVFLRIMDLYSLIVIGSLFILTLLIYTYRLLQAFSISFKSSMQKTFIINFLLFIGIILLYFYFSSGTNYFYTYLRYFFRVVH